MAAVCKCTRFPNIIPEVISFASAQLDIGNNRILEINVVTMYRGIFTAGSRKFSQKDFPSVSFVLYLAVGASKGTEVV